MVLGDPEAEEQPCSPVAQEVPSPSAAESIELGQGMWALKTLKDDRRAL